MSTQGSKHIVRNLTIFTFLVYALGWLGRWVDSLSGGAPSEQGIGILLWLVAPLGVSFLLRAFAGDGWSDLGIRPAIKGNLSWYIVSILVYPVCTAFILAVGAALGAVSLSGFSAGAFVQACVPDARRQQCREQSPRSAGLHQNGEREGTPGFSRHRGSTRHHIPRSSRRWFTSAQNEKGMKSAA